MSLFDFKVCIIMPLTVRVGTTTVLADATVAEDHSLSLPKKESSRLCDADFNDFKNTARCIEDDETNSEEVVLSDI